KPIAGVPVNLGYSGQREVSLPVATSIGRGVITDAEGRFAFDPVPAGEYQLKVEENLADPLHRDLKTYDVNDVFLPKPLLLKAESKPAAIELQAVPHVVVHAQYVDSAGKKSTGHEFFLHGQIDGQFWNARGRPSKEGTIALRVPHGLEEVRMQLMTNEHSSLRYRKGPGEPLQDDTFTISLGTLTDDIVGFEIIRYKAPILLISAVDPAGQPLKNLKVVANYVKPRPAQYISFQDGSDFNFEAQANGVYRSSQMLPDEEVKLQISAEGFAPVLEKLQIPEGETRELKVRLSKAAAAEGAKSD
ncbi:MAG: carboxypeptidase regulatory-like domain-containing protein, partial [Planctomycetes bacterium]|nr:carboxypeptidase regulatory-like domain-containing protein [Planctomycetota bacterium]